MKIVILGAGIGGTTLALALQRAGLDFTVLEQADAFGEIGAGVQLSSNAVKVLARLRPVRQPRLLPLLPLRLLQHRSLLLVSFLLPQELGMPLQRLAAHAFCEG